MSAYIPFFRSKDPNDVEPRNFDASGKLALIGNPTVLDCDVSVDGAIVVDGVAICADGLLVITAVAFDPVTKRVSFTWSGGTLGKTYCVTCTLTLSSTWQVSQSGLVEIAQH